MFERFKFNIINIKLARGEHNLYDEKLFQKATNIGYEKQVRTKNKNISSNTRQ